MRALWLPYVVADLAVAKAFYTDHLGLSEVDSWERPHERGSVLRVAEGAVIELVEAGLGAGVVWTEERRERSDQSDEGRRRLLGPPGPRERSERIEQRAAQGPSPPIAFEADGVRAVDSYAARFRATPHRYPRGHYGFEVPGPAGATVMIWSEQ